MARVIEFFRRLFGIQSNAVAPSNEPMDLEEMDVRDVECAQNISREVDRWYPLFNREGQ